MYKATLQMEVNVGMINNTEFLFIFLRKGNNFFLNLPRSSFIPVTPCRKFTPTSSYFTLLILGQSISLLEIMKKEIPANPLIPTTLSVWNSSVLSKVKAFWVKNRLHYFLILSFSRLFLSCYSLPLFLFPSL